MYKALLITRNFQNNLNTCSLFYIFSESANGNCEEISTENPDENPNKNQLSLDSLWQDNKFGLKQACNQRRVSQIQADEFRINRGI